MIIDPLDKAVADAAYAQVLAEINRLSRMRPGTESDPASALAAKIMSLTHAYIRELGEFHDRRDHRGASAREDMFREEITELCCAAFPRQSPAPAEPSTVDNRSQYQSLAEWQAAEAGAPQNVQEKKP